jgi:hypothetical protein
MTKAFQTREFSRVSSWAGGAPRVAARAVIDEEEDAMRLDRGDRGVAATKFLVLLARSQATTVRRTAA